MTGKSCHGSMPWEGKNPLEWGAPILAEAAKRYEARDGFLDHPFLGHGTRTASWARLDTPSDCAVPERFVFRFDRRLTIGETPEKAVADVERLDAVAAARAAGLTVDVTVPTYDEPTWTGFVLHNPQVYMGWLTPEEHPAIQAAVAAYRGVVSPHVPEGGRRGALRKEPRVDRWIFSTDGVGFPVPKDDTSIAVPESKRWVTSGAVKHPAMLGIGPGHRAEHAQDRGVRGPARGRPRGGRPRALPERVRVDLRLGDDPRRGAREPVHDGAADAAAGDREREELRPLAARAQRREQVAGDLLGGRTEKKKRLLWKERRESASGRGRATSGCDRK